MLASDASIKLFLCKNNNLSENHLLGSFQSSRDYLDTIYFISIMNGGILIIFTIHKIGERILKKKIIMLTFSLLLLAIIGIYLFAGEKKGEEILTRVDNRAVLDMLEEQQDGLIYVGRPTCDDCVAFVPVLEQALGSKGKQALYFNTDDNKVSQVLFDQVIDLLDIEMVPTVVAIEDGQIAAKLQGNADQDMMMSWLESLD